MKRLSIYNGQIMILTIVVCTYDRSENLKKSIESVLVQTLDKSKWELIVVDNNSSDKSREVVCKYAAVYNNIRYVFEGNQGLSYARNRGLHEAKGEFVAFIDDDACATPSWAERIISSFQSIVPTPGVVGGKILPLFDNEPPFWFSDQLELVGMLDKAAFLSQDNAVCCLSGSNMAFQKSLLIKIKGFSPEFGMLGNAIGLGEETELFYRIFKICPLFWYDPDIQVQHYVHSSKMKLRYVVKRAYISGNTSAKINKLHDNSSGILPQIMGIAFVIKEQLSSFFSKKNKIEVSVLSCQSIAFKIGYITGYLSGRNG